MRLFFLSLFLFFVFGNLSWSSNRIVAIVNNEIITEKELKDYISLIKFRLSLKYDQNSLEFLKEFQKQKQQALDKLIEDRLIIQEAHKKNIEIPQKLIEKKLNEFILNFKDEYEFEASLRERGLSIFSLKEKIKEQLLIQRTLEEEVRSKIEIKPYELTQFYNSHIKEFIVEPSIDYRALKFSSELEAYQASQELKEANKEIVIKKYSQYLIQGRLNKEKAREELKEIFKLKEGEVSLPIEIDKEFIIFIIDKKYPPRRASLEEVKEKIYSRLYQEKFKERLKTHLKDLKQKAIIKKYYH